MTQVSIGEKEKNEQIKGLISNMWLFFFVKQYNSSLSSFVPKFRILTQVVAVKSLTEKKVYRQTDKHNYRKGKTKYRLYTSYRGYKAKPC